MGNTAMFAVRTTDMGSDGVTISYDIPETSRGLVLVSERAPDSRVAMFSDGNAWLMTGSKHDFIIVVTTRDMRMGFGRTRFQTSWPDGRRSKGTLHVRSDVNGIVAKITPSGSDVSRTLRCPFPAPMRSGQFRLRGVYPRDRQAIFTLVVDLFWGLVVPLAVGLCIGTLMALAWDRRIAW